MQDESEERQSFAPSLLHRSAQIVLPKILRQNDWGRTMEERFILAGFIPAACDSVANLSIQSQAGFRSYKVDFRSLLSSGFST